jgi:hypothetical protein
MTSPTTPFNFHPITHADPVTPHEGEPAEESHNEVFERYGQTSSGQAENRRHLAGHTEQHQQDEQQADRLEGKAHYNPQGPQAPRIGNEMRDKSVHRTIEQGRRRAQSEE